MEVWEATDMVSIANTGRACSPLRAAAAKGLAALPKDTPGSHGAEWTEFRRDVNDVSLWKRIV